MKGVSVPAWQAAIAAREEILGRDVLVRMAEIYVSELDDLLSRIRTALDAGDLRGARRGAHYLGGSAGALDFNDLSKVAGLLETQCIRADADGAYEALRVILPLSRQCADLLRRQFGVT